MASKNTKSKAINGKPKVYTEELRKKHLGRVREHLDLTLNLKEEIRFRKRHIATIKKLAEELPFTQEEIESLMIVYYKLQKGEGQQKLSKHKFKEVLHDVFDITSEELKRRISYAADKSPTRFISLANWLKTMAVFLRGTLDDQIQHCFQVYDTLSQGFISKYQMGQLMQNCIIDHDSEEDVKDLIEILSRKLDKDRDGIVSFNDYKTACMEQPLLMECFGDCLPERKPRTAFLSTFTQYWGKL